MDLERFDRILRIRVIASSILYATFAGVGLHGVITGWHFDNPTPTVILLVVAFLTWPRRSHPKGWKPDKETTSGRQEARGRQITQRWINRVRLFYFFAAFFVLALLPHFLGEPVFQIY